MAYNISNILRAVGGRYGGTYSGSDVVQSALESQGKYNLAARESAQEYDLSVQAAALAQSQFEESQSQFDVGTSQWEKSFTEEKRLADQAYTTEQENAERKRKLKMYLEGGGTAAERKEFYDSYTSGAFSKLPTSGAYSLTGETASGTGTDYSKMSASTLADLAIKAKEQATQAKYYGKSGSDWLDVYRNVMGNLT